MTNEQVYLKFKDKLEKGDKLQKKGCSPKDYADFEQTALDLARQILAGCSKNREKAIKRLEKSAVDLQNKAIRHNNAANILKIKGE